MVCGCVCWVRVVEGVRVWSYVCLLVCVGGIFELFVGANVVCECGYACCVRACVGVFVLYVCMFRSVMAGVFVWKFVFVCLCVWLCV